MRTLVGDRWLGAVAYSGSAISGRNDATWDADQVVVNDVGMGHYSYFTNLQAKDHRYSTSVDPLFIDYPAVRTHSH